MIQGLLAIALIASSLQLHCGGLKDVFVIDFKKKGIGAWKPKSINLSFFKENPEGRTEEELKKMEQLNYEDQTFSEPIPFPNGLITQKGFKYAEVSGYVWVEDVPAERSMLLSETSFEIKPGYYYTLSRPTYREVGPERRPRYACPDGTEGGIGSGRRVCVTAEKIK